MATPLKLPAATARFASDRYSDPVSFRAEKISICLLTNLFPVASVMSDFCKANDKSDSSSSASNIKPRFYKNIGLSNFVPFLKTLIALCCHLTCHLPSEQNENVMLHNYFRKHIFHLPIFIVV